MKIITFYSYKGGVGRTMCLANIAVLLAKWGHKVLMVDWDWEAPGLERYFVSDNFNGKTTASTPAGIDLSIVKEKPGLVDLLTERKKDGWKEAIIQIPIPDAREPLHFISAGRRDDDYFKRVRDFNVDTFYAKKKGGQFIEDLRRAWRDAYDFILIDSRTGVSEINGISTIQMPNLVVLLFTATNQSFEGALDIAYRSSSAHQKLPYDRGQLLFLPLLSRVEVAVGHLTDQWIARFSKDLEPLYQPWLPTENPNIKINEFMMRTKIPHDPYYTFGEKLSVVEDGTIDPARMGYAYEGIASLIANKLERVEEFVTQRRRYVRGGRQTVFISYNHRDSIVAREVSNYLERSGLDVILDQDDMAAGHSIMEFVQDSIKKADVTISIISSAGLQSDWAGQEMLASMYAIWLADKKFIPVSLDSVAFDIDFQITASQNLTQKIKDFREKIKKLEELGGDTRNLRDDLNRMVELKNNFGKIIQRLTSVLMLSISGDSFEPTMKKVLASI